MSYSRIAKLSDDRTDEEVDSTGHGGGSDSQPIDSMIRMIARAEPMTPPLLLTRGTKVGHYEIHELLGRGGMGTVYRAVDTRLGRHVALKILETVPGRHERYRRFLREARSAVAASHPNVATMYEVGEVDHVVYLAMEFVEGCNLRTMLLGGALGAEKGVRLAREIALGLASAHVKGVVHRDLKPENVMITPGGSVKILDFGLAKLRVYGDTSSPGVLAQQETETLEGIVMGTPWYMAPEQASGGMTDARTDVYAFGIVLHEMITGTRPGLLDSCSAIADPRLAAVVRRCVASVPEARWANAGEIVDALDALRVAPGKPRHPRVLALAVGLAAIAIAVAAIRSWRRAAGVSDVPVAPPVAPGSAGALSGDADPVAADAAAPLRFSTPTQIVALSLRRGEGGPSLTEDMLEIYFQSNQTIDGDSDIWVSRRRSLSDAWSKPVQATELNGAESEIQPRVSRDGLQIYFGRYVNRTAGYDLFMSTRLTRAAPWSRPVAVSEFNTTDNEFEATTTADDLMIAFDSDRGGASGDDLYVATRATVRDPWGTPRRLDEIDTDGDESNGQLSADGLTLWFTKATPTTSKKIYVTTRASRRDPFGAPRAITELNSTHADADEWVSDDERTVVFASDRWKVGTYQLFQATRPARRE